MASSDIKLSAVREDEGCVISAGGAAKICMGRTRWALVEAEVKSVYVQE